MIEPIFYLFIFVIIALIYFGLVSKQPGAIAVAGVFSILLGALFLSGVSLELQKPDNFSTQDVNADNTQTSIVYKTLDSSDELIFMLQYLFFLGGFALLIIALVISTRTTPQEVEEFEEQVTE